MHRLLVIGLGVTLAFALAAETGARADDKPAAEAAEDGAGGHGADGHAADHGSTPDLPMKWKGDLALFSLITFVVFLLALRAVAWDPLRKALDGRESGIARNIADAEASRIKAEQMLAEHERKLAKVHDEVKEILNEARRDADHARQTILSDAQKEAEATRARAVADIERAKNHALDELFSAMSDRVLSASEHVIGRSLNDGDQRRLVDEALTQLATKA